MTHLHSVDSVSSTVASGLLGRTNREFPSVWLSLSPPDDNTQLDALIEAASESGAPIDITSQPALWGAKIRNPEATIMAIGSTAHEHATEEGHACDLVQAHLIEVLSCAGRETIDFYFLRVRKSLQEFQISGALQAMEIAIQEGHVRYLGICCDGESMATLGAWQFHDAFETLLVPRNHKNPEPYTTLKPLARERRVGIVTSRPLNWGYGLPFFTLPELWRLPNLTQSFYGLTLAQAVIADLAEDNPVLVGVKTAEEVRQAVAAPTMKRPTGLESMLQPFLEAFDSDEQWKELLASPVASHREAAKRRFA